MNWVRSLNRSLPFLAALGLVLPVSAAAIPATALAQTTGSREVVQALPSPEVARLNDALHRLARNSRDIDALIDAGNAALGVGDLDAAIGFFGRAQELSPSNAAAKLGMAAVHIRSERPFDALRLFAEAESAGTSSSQFSAERGLAYDLVGNNAEAQRSYRAALAAKKDDEVTRRLALSQAIAGDRAGFEETLLPLLERRDFPAYRTRAFGLAILGDLDDATAIAEAVMPRELSGRITPYLAYMPQLTRAQQAAAANLGIFPSAAQIGRDDPQLAQYSTARGLSEAGGKLAPQGQPLGVSSRSQTDSSRRRPDRTGSRSNASALASSSPVNSGELPAIDGSSRLAAVTREQVASKPKTQPDISAFQLPEGQPPGRQSPSQQRPEQSPVSRQGPANLSVAFADLGSPVENAKAPASGAVNIAAIDVPRDAPPKPKPPLHPSRIWVQVATGKNVSALRFDWRRMARKAPELLGDYKPHVVRWGQANRLLAGPLPSAAASRNLINALKAKGIDTFGYTSPEGEEIKEIR